jgi:hypothetical protein
MSREHRSGRVRRCVVMLAALPVAMLAFLAPAPAGARTGPCEPVRLAPSTAGIPVSWRAALEALARATAEEGLPWGCPGGTAELVPDASGGAVLIVIDAAGHAVSRRVAGPGEVVPTGEALLATPLGEAPAPPPAERPALPAPAPAPPPPPPPAGPTDPRLQIQALLGPRASGPGTMVWASGELRMLIPFGPWSPAAWVRYDIHAAGPRNAPANFGTSAVSAGLGVARRIVPAPFELYVILDTSLAVVIMEDGSDALPHPEGAKPALRLGTGLYGTFPLHGIVRGVLKVDGEFAPAGIGGLQIAAGQQPLLPLVPGYTAGLSLGMQVTVR